ncbi:hypothetical protein ABE237_22250 [Brevibacillus formosus]|uniref:hypothetical protein n=1 Tax=Brevibacillus formosus TaxID=54913 RepID=UPI0018CDD952|nr:hypothetical protein [Brevibacillus formosus]MBG9942602.1 hypothetical protein [Brevibacillus formosus]
MSVKTRVLIGSPVCQEPDVLRMFLFSLERLSRSNLTLHYLFVDDNTDPLSSNILQNFADKQTGQVDIIPAAGSLHPYTCDERTHDWSEALVWKVAGFKDEMIARAKHHDYDALFLIDSDLLLQPATLEVLLASEKEIISEIFWTSWTPDTVPAPQVWLKDEYTQFECARHEQISLEEQYLRKYAFYGQLRVPGVYEVGGLGACTLIRRKALQAGVSFKQIANLSFWGEDRHFCIRAQALGLSLFVDTHHPAFHLYRESDFAEARIWMKQIYGSAPLRVKTTRPPVANNTITLGN